jgi:alkylation response protein AidB-like acyl-CoA dehydrogenase
MRREPQIRPVELSAGFGDLRAVALAVNGDAQRALELAGSLASIPRPGEGKTAVLFDTLCTVAAADLTAARVVEAHLDARAILAQAGRKAQPDHTWGVFAAETADSVLTATPEGDRWRLDGTKPWCSLAGRLTHALVTAHVGDHGRRPVDRTWLAAGEERPGRFRRRSGRCGR